MNSFFKCVLSGTACAALAVMLTACPSPEQKAPTYELPATEDIVMYQVNPRVFAPENSLRAVAEHVGEIADLGCNVVWVMPIYPIGTVKSKNSPYSISDYTAIAPEFGTIDDFKALVDTCHAHGMSLILDWVANHTAWDSKWLNEGHKDWYTQDEKGEIVSPIPDWSDVADLNYDNTDMRAAMREAMLYWINDIGIDGFRCDVADEVPLDFWKGAIDSLRAAAAPRRIVMLAEGNHVENLTVAGFDMNYAWDFMHDLRKVWAGEPATLALKSDSAEYAQLPAGKVKMRFTTNHDESAAVGTPYGIFGGDRGAMAAYVATVFLHGGPLIYGSQEVGYQEPINFFNYVAVDWKAKPEIRAEYTKLIELLKTNSPLMHGAPAGIPDDNVLAFTKGDNEFLVLVNVRDKENTLALPEPWAGKQVTDLMTGKNRELLNAVTLQPYEYLILKR